MIFPRYQVARIVKGKMTETLVRAEGQAECRLRKGRVYSVQLPKGTTAARMLVKSVDRGLLSDVDDDAARRMGYATASDYFEWWREKHGDGPLIEIPVWVVRFELNHSHRPTYLAAHAGRLAKSDYTHNEADALDAGEPPDAATLGEFAARSRERMAVVKADDRRKQEARSIGAQVKEGLSRARLIGADVDEEVHQIREALAEIHRKARDAA